MNKKLMLNNGVLVKLRNGEKRFVWDGKIEIMPRDPFGLSLSEYDDDLRHKTNRDYDIMERYSLTQCPPSWKRVEIVDLRETEKEFLNNLIKPFKLRNPRVIKYKNCEKKDKEYIGILFENDDDNIYLPDFPKGAYYTGMEQDKTYTLAELGIEL